MGLTTMLPEPKPAVKAPGDASYWSTFEFEQGESYANWYLRLFSCAKGGVTRSGKVAGIAETNLDIPEELPDTFRVMRVAWTISGGTEADRLYLATRASWAWEFNTFTILEGTPLDAYNTSDQPSEWASDDERQAWLRERAEQIELLRSRLPGAVLGLHSYTARYPICIPAGARFAIRLRIPAEPLLRRFEAVTRVKFTLFGEPLNVVPIA